MSRSFVSHRGSVRGRSRGHGRHGEQRWWDPVWRSERLKRLKPETEVLNKDELRTMIEQFKRSTDDELLIKRTFSREDQLIIGDMASQLNLYFRAYNKHRSLVVSKLPLPDYRADLDELHGSSKKEIRMSSYVKQRVADLLYNSQVVGSHMPSEGSCHGVIPSASHVRARKHSAALETVASLENLNSKESKVIQMHDNAKESGSLKDMQAFREKLPAFKVRNEFLRAVAENQALVISGETGCGKTTQLPQYILEEQISSLGGAQCNIICTQPRRISAISAASRISSERGESLGEHVGYQIRLESCCSPCTKLLFCTTGVLLRRLLEDPHLDRVSHLIVDEIHERGMNEDFLLIILRDLLPRRPDLRLILMSATIKADLFSEYFGIAPVIHIPGFTFPVSEVFLEDILEETHYIVQPNRDNTEWNTRKNKQRMHGLKTDPLTELFEGVDISIQYKDYSPSVQAFLEAWSPLEIELDLVVAVIEYISLHKGPGAILVFLTGWNEISELFDRIGRSSFLGDKRKFLIYPLHGSMPTFNQCEIFDRPPPGKRKIILATNIAESSITIDDVVYVIDCGKAKETSYDALNKLASLLPSWISKASAHQRRGRAGRVQPGVCYRLYPKIIHDAMPEHQLPEILRTPLQELCLQVKSLKLGKIGTFLAKALQPPDSLAVHNAIGLLIEIGALDDNEKLTSLGHHLCTLPMDPNIGKMLLMGCIFQCLNPTLTIAAVLSHRDPFVLPIDRKKDAEAAKRSFAGDSCSDHIALVDAFEGYREAKFRNKERQFCWNNFLSPSVMKAVADMREQLLNLLSEIGFVDKSRGPSAYNQYSNDLEMVSAILCAGLYPNIVHCKKKGKHSAFYSKDVGKVLIHPGSVNFRTTFFPHPFLVYSEKVRTSKIYLRDSTSISDYALLLFGGTPTPDKDGKGIEMLGGYIRFYAEDTVLQLIKEVRKELDMLLKRKIDDPSFDISFEGQRVVSAVVELLHSHHNAD